MTHKNLICICIFLALLSCNQEDNKIKDEVAAFLTTYNEKNQKLITTMQEAWWKATVEINKGNNINDSLSQKAQEAYAEFKGSKEVIEKVTGFLKKKEQLEDLQVRQLEFILMYAGNSPQTVPDLVKQRIKLESETATKLYSYGFKLNGRPVTTNQIDSILRNSTDTAHLRAAWESSKEVGKALKKDLASLRDLRNKTVQALNYKDFFSYQVGDYEMTTEEMVKMNRDILNDVWPLYRELHTYMRYEMAKKLKADVPDYLPAHWLPNRWGQDWSGFVKVKGADIDGGLKNFSATEIVKRGESFYKSIGFDPLSASFWQKSSLYPFPADSAVQKDVHASAWNINMIDDFRSNMSIEGNAYWWETAHHELGHIYYFMEYANKDVPIVLRSGANRAYHEAMGTLIGLASMQLPYLQSQNIIGNDPADSIQKMMKEAMLYVNMIPWSLGVVTQFEKSLYADGLPEQEFNKKWWELVKKYQGIVPPAERGEEYCDAATKTHVIDDAAQYYDYAIANCLLMQMHMHIATKILKQDPHAANYYGNKEIGKFLKSIMYWGQSKNWRQVLKESTGDDINAKALLQYFQPLLDWLRVENKNRKHTLPESID